MQDLLKQKEVSDEDWRRLEHMLTPAESGKATPLDVQQPSIAAIDCSPTELGTLIGKLVLESLLPLIAAGESQTQRTSTFCRTVRAAMCPRRYKCAILKAAIGEAAKMVACVLMLADRTAEVDLEALGLVFGSRTGNKLLLRQALQQNVWYRCQEAHVRSTHSATKTLLPEMLRVKELLSKESSQENIDLAISQLPAWRNSMRPGMTADLEGELRKALSERLEALTASGSVAELKTFHASADTLAQCAITADLKKNHLQNDTFSEIAAKAFSITSSQEKKNRESRLLDAIQGFVRLSKAWGAEGGLPALSAASENLHDAISVSNDHGDDFDESTKVQCTNVGSSVAGALQTTLLSAAEQADSQAYMAVASVLLNICKFLEVPAFGVLQTHHRLAELLLQVREKLLKALSQGMGVAEISRAGMELLTCEKECASQKTDESSCEAAVSNLQGLRDSAKTLIEEVSSAVADSTMASVTAAAKKIQDVVGGKAGGKSWKDAISDPGATYSWQDIVVAAEPLLKGDSGSLVQGFRALKQERALRA